MKERRPEQIRFRNGQFGHIMPDGKIYKDANLLVNSWQRRPLRPAQPGRERQRGQMTTEEIMAKFFK